VTHVDTFQVVRNFANVHDIKMKLDAEAPGNFMGISSNGSMALSWTAPPPLGKIAYDDGSAETWYWVGDPTSTNHMFYVRLTVPVAGSITHISVADRSGEDGTTTYWQSIKLCRRTAVAGGYGVPNLTTPMATFNNVAVTSDDGGWDLLQLTTPVAVAANDTIYIVTQWTDGSLIGPLLGTDTNGTAAHRSAYTEDGTTWYQFSSNWIMRAYMTNGREPVSLTTHEKMQNGQALLTRSILHNNAKSRSLNSLHPGDVIAKSVRMPEIINTANQAQRTFLNYRLYKGTTPTNLTL
jgi:hypothetical protein